jgi:hypothetical protein
MTFVQNIKSVRKTLRRLIVSFLLICVSQVHAGDTAPLPAATEGVRYVITPYLWFLGMTGKVDYNNVQRVDTKIDTNQLLSTFDIGGMLEGEIHYGRWGIAGNGLYSKSSSLSSKSYLRDQALTVGSNTTSWIGIYTVAGTYTAVSTPYFYLDTLAGARFLNLNSKVALNASVANTPYTGDRTLYSSVSATDAIGGIKGRARISESNFYVPFYVDAGGGSSVAKLTTQQVLGIGYAFSQADISLVYSNLYYSMNKNQVSSYLNMSGPALAATFRF